MMVNWHSVAFYVDERRWTCDWKKAFIGGVLSMLPMEAVNQEI